MVNEKALKIKIENNRSLDIAISAIKKIQFDAGMVVTIAKFKKNRTLAQNKLFHSWCNEISLYFFEAFGEAYSALAIKELLKRLFLGVDCIETPDKKIVEITKKTSELGTKDFKVFLEKVEFYAADEWECQLRTGEDFYYEAMGYSSARR